MPGIGGGGRGRGGHGGREGVKGVLRSHTANQKKKDVLVNDSRGVTVIGKCSFYLNSLLSMKPNGTMSYIVL